MRTLNRTGFLLAIEEAAQRIYGSEEGDPLTVAVKLGIVPKDLPDLAKKAARILGAFKYFSPREFRQFSGTDFLAGIRRAEEAWDNYQELLAGEQDQSDPGEEAEQGC